VIFVLEDTGENTESKTEIRVFFERAMVGSTHYWIWRKNPQPRTQM